MKVQPHVLLSEQHERTITANLRVSRRSGPSRRLPTCFSEGGRHGRHARRANCATPEGPRARGAQASNRKLSALSPSFTRSRDRYQATRSWAYTIHGEFLLEMRHACPMLGRSVRSSLACVYRGRIIGGRRHSCHCRGGNW